MVQVIGCRVVLENADDVFLSDPEGQSLAASLNTHLPPSVRVLSVQRVNKKFNARRACMERTYEYYLPASLLGMKCDGSEEDARILRWGMWHGVVGWLVWLVRQLTCWLGTEAPHLVVDTVNTEANRLVRAPRQMQGTEATGAWVTVGPAAMAAVYSMTPRGHVTVLPVLPAVRSVRHYSCTRASTRSTTSRSGASSTRHRGSSKVRCDSVCLHEIGVLA